METGWILISAILVFIMQAGFLCLESGKIRTKNSINVAAKNLSDFILSSILFWCVGFGIMFGYSNSGYFGATEFFFGAEHSPWQFSFFLFQMMFCGTTATLVSGAVAERMSYFGYLIVTVLLCAIIYPFVGHWAWASLYDTGNSGWLENLGFVDFAGSTVVHSTGGWMALAAIMVIGARQGRFDSNTPFPAGSNLPLSVLGTLLIWVGWFGFNGGSTLALNDDVPLILVNTCIAAAFGGLASSFIFAVENRYMDVSAMLNGVIAGLVAITACANIVSPAHAAIIGIGGGIVMFAGDRLLKRLKLDDALCVVPAHLFAGIWGTLAVALFHKDIVFLSDSFWQQLSVQALGITVIGLYVFCLSWILLVLINREIRLRVTSEQEYIGMNITEHHATTELVDLLNSMDAQEKSGNFHSRVPEEPFTEVGQIARKYNRVLDKVHDEMSQRDRALSDFKSSEKRKSAILNSSMDSIVTINLQGEIIEFNPASERTFGCLRGKVVGKNFVDLFVLSKDKLAVQKSLEGKFVTSDGLLINRRNTILLKRSTGDEFPSEITITGTTFGSSIANEFTLHIRDVTRQRRLQEKLKQLAYSDPLTGLYNRTYFMETLTQALKSINNTKNCIALFFLDLDRFKKINDTLGHQAGDELLMEVANRLMNVTRSEDTICRWGGDEFVIMMNSRHDESSVLTSATKILQVMRQPVVLSGRELTIPTSIGVTLTHTDLVNPTTLIQQADIAMYYAKKAGRDNYKLFEPYMAEQESEQFDSEQTLSQAIAEKSAFSMLYQPRVDANKEIVGFEALVRFTNPSGLFVPPSQFIPLAEESNLIVPLEELIFELVFAQIAQWKKTFAVLPRVSINLSGKHLLSDGLLPFLKTAMQRYGIRGEWFEIEVTEGVFLADIETCIDVMQKLHSLNIAISIDDFGTGYSSLNYLKTLPVDILKIDRSFVNECAVKEEDAKICSTIITLAESLGLSTVAEGVETAEQFEFLLSNGCSEFQGYHFFRPLSADKVTQHLGQLNELSVS